MQELINESIMTMVNDGSISIERLNSLVYIKELVDRISTKTYIGEETANELQDKYGVRPNIITWGDYFQTEMATSLLVVSDSEFDRAVETLRFDMAASWVIFSEKEGTFFKWVDDTFDEITGAKCAGYTEEEEEILHLKILKDYFTNLGIVNGFTADEMRWFEGFEEERVV
jgi:hypothetical protein